jgi:hypothetical protein
MKNLNFYIYTMYKYHLSSQSNLRGQIVILMVCLVRIFIQYSNRVFIQKLKIRIPVE